MLTYADLLAGDNVGPSTTFRRGVTAGPAAELSTGPRGDLAVDTATLRAAAELLDNAVGAFRGDGSCEVFRCPLSDASLGSSAAGREVVASSARRVAEAVEGAGMLALRAATVVEKLRAAAQHFDLVEASSIPGPR